MRNNNIIRFLLYFLFGFFNLFSVVLYTACKWSKETYGVSLDELIFTLSISFEGANMDVVYIALRECLPLITVVMLIYIFLVICDCLVKKIPIHIKTSLRILVVIATFVSLVLCFAYVDKQYAVVDYIKSMSTETKIYDTYYIDPNSVTITSDSEPKNLILIYLESMESTYASVDEGGYQSINLIPNLTKLANYNTSFSNTEKLGGFYCSAGATNTVRALFATASGIPYAFPVETKEMRGYSFFGSGVTALGDILEEKGYTQEFLCGSAANYGGRRQFYEQHGSHKIFDYYTAGEKGYISKDYFVWWGYEDKYLYEIAKDELTALAKEDEPFNLTMLTVDTHFIDGYVCDLCENTYPEKAANVVSCADKQIADFIGWCKDQDFYEDTVIVIIGDHPRMDTSLVENVPAEDRRVYNCFINTDTKILGSSINRDFVAMDIFPTVLAAMGYKIEGDRLALGTNLFSKEKTLAEELGFDYLDAEFEKRSTFYARNFY